MSQLLEEVPFSAFPTTFQEVIIIVHRLGIDFSWIDCYCIIQGSDSQALRDWEHEAARMGQVYSNALINIGAAHASSPSHGLFSKRNVENFTTIPLRWRPYLQNDETRYRIWKSSLYDFDGAFHQLSESQLIKRAGVVQEYVLSPRMKAFWDSQVFWQCAEAAACEDFPAIENTMKYPTSHPFWLLINIDDLV